MGELIKDKEIIYQMAYALEMLSYKGISISDTIFKSLQYFIDCYHASNDDRYLDSALLLVKVGLEFNIMIEKNLLLYHEVCRLSGITIDQIIEKELYIAKRIKLNKSQVRNIFRRWMPSKKNKMSVSELVDDIIYKVSTNVEGSYTYCYRKYSEVGKEERLKNDIYHLVITASECYLIDLKGFTVYTFLEEN